MRLRAKDRGPSRIGTLAARGRGGAAGDENGCGEIETSVWGVYSWRQVGGWQAVMRGEATRLAVVFAVGVMASSWRADCRRGGP